MIEALRVVNFQSLRDVSLELGRLTVIVGPSSSGKSALMRALRVLASNSRGAPYVSHGQRVAAVSAQNEHGLVTIERGEGHGMYRVGDLQFTKLGGEVPAQVTELLRIQPVRPGEGSINFAGQFDRPYLLDDSGSQVARILGELTNVSVIFEAAREANRRRLASAQALKTRQADLDSLLDLAREYKTLPDRRAALEEAEEQIAAAQAAHADLQRLRRLLSDLSVAESALDRASAAVELEPPSMSEVEGALSRQSEFAKLLRELSRQVTAKSTAAQRAQDLAEELRAAELELHDVLEEAGVCPLCGQSTRELASVGSS